MNYKNTVTGVVISTPCVISGGDWVPLDQTLVREEVEIKETVLVEPEKEQGEEIADNVPNGITKKQIMQEFDAFSVKYNKQSSKQELYDLMLQQGE